MSVALVARRAAVFARPSVATAFIQSRAASTSHGHEHEHGQEEYPPEGFATPFWRNVLLAGAATVAFFKFAPAADDNVYLTRWIAMYKTHRDQWLERNAYHTLLSMDCAEGSLLLNDAKKPKKYQLRYPQALDRGSPYMNAVGTQVDLSDLQGKV